MSEIVHPRPLKGYRPCVGIVLFNADGLVFLGKRSTKGVVPQYSWQMPQGGVDRGETPEQAARRELYEETSVSAVAPLGEVDGWLHYDLPGDVANWRGRYRGQAQRWFAYRFTGDENEIDVVRPPDGHPQEFARWRWEKLSLTPSIVVPFKRAVYEHVARAFEAFSLPREPLANANLKPLRGSAPEAI